MNPQTVAREIADAVLGKAKPATRAFDGDLSIFAGNYQGRGRGRPTEIRIEARGQELHFLRGTGATATDETLQFLGSDTFGVRDTLLRFRREGGKVTNMRLDSVGVNVLLTRKPAS